MSPLKRLQRPVVGSMAMFEKVAIAQVGMRGGSLRGLGLNLCRGCLRNVQNTFIQQVLLSLKRQVHSTACCVELALAFLV